MLSSQARRNDGVRVPVMDAAVPVRSKSSKAEGGKGRVWESVMWEDEHIVNSILKYDYCTVGKFCGRKFCNFLQNQPCAF